MLLLLSRRRIGRRLRAARTYLDLDEDGFAHELGLSTDTYRDIERGEVDPDLDTLLLAAQITGKSVDFLLTGRSPNIVD